jgi:HD superfamily phosphohydrolase YqeK
LSKIEENKARTIDLWQQIDQPIEKIEAFLRWLEKSDYFKAPCSTEYHLSVAGGLAQHSLNVFDALSELAVRYKADVTVSDLIICGLGHDLCKANFYIPGTRNVKNEMTGQWEKKFVYKVEDQAALGHGEKSLSILQDYFSLSLKVKMAVRWHMGGWCINGDYATQQAYNKASEVTELVALMHAADMIATHVTERGQ